jgi:hypothetical protein
MKNTYFLSLLLVLFFAIPLDAGAQAVGDYDGDGTSDLSLALVDRGRNYTAYLTRRSGAPDTPFFWEFNVAADAFAPGKYFGDGRIYPGIVRVIAVGQPLQWHFKRPDGSDLSIQYGLPGDSVPNHGPDFDGDGISDIYVVRDGSPDFFPGFKVWHIALSSTGTVHQKVFGMTSDRVFGGDVNGNGRAEMIALRPSTYEWFSADIFATDVSQITAQQWGLPGDIPLLPQDMNGDGKPDYIISRREGAMQFAYIRYSDVNFEKRPIGLATSVPSVGKFNPQRAESDFAWQQRDTGWAASRNPDTTVNFFRHGIATNAIIRPDGTVVQPNEDGRFPGSSVAPSQPDAPSSSPPSGAPGCTPSPGTKDRFRGNGDLWKPHSESTGKVVILLPSSYTSASVEILGRDGNVISTPERTRCCPNGGRMHFWMNRDRNFMAQHAPVTARVRRGATTECRVVPDPRRRYE